jgi:hypothetical protein
MDVKQFLSFCLFVDISPVLSSFLAEMLERHVIFPKKCAKNCTLAGNDNHDLTEKFKSLS